MSKLINTILVCTTIMCCCSVKASVNTEYFNMLEFSKEILDTCSIDTSSTSDINITPPSTFGKYGALYYTSTNKYLVDEKDNYFYDWNTLINKLVNPPTGTYKGEWFDSLNLVTKPNSGNQYIIGNNVSNNIE